MCCCNLPSVGKIVNNVEKLYAEKISEGLNMCLCQLTREKIVQNQGTLNININFLTFSFFLYISKCNMQP